MSHLGDLLKTLDKMVNDQFDSVEFKALLDLPLTMERGRFYVGAKRTLHQQSTRLLGLCPRRRAAGGKARNRGARERRVDQRSARRDGSLRAHRQTGRGNRPYTGYSRRPKFRRWCAPASMRGTTWPCAAAGSAAYTASHMLERRNNGKIVNGGGMSYRVGKKFENELGINLKRMISLDVHVAADMDHSENISAIFERYVKTPQDCELVLQGARDSMAVDRAYRGALGFYMAQIR